MPTLTRGQKTKLADLTPSLQLRAEISATSTALKFDFSCFGVDESGQLSDDRFFVFYNQKTAPDNAITMSGNAQFDVDLSRLPATIKKLVFVITIDGAGEMRSLNNGSFRLMANGQEVARFDFAGADFGAEKALMVAEIYFKDVWRLAAVGQGFCRWFERAAQTFRRRRNSTRCAHSHANSSRSAANSCTASRRVGAEREFDQSDLGKAWREKQA